VLTIIAEGKKYQLTNEQVITVKRITVREYYLLVASLLIYKQALANLVNIQGIKDPKKYIDYIKEHSIDIAKTKVEFDNIKLYLKDCVDINIEKLDQGIVIEILNYVMEFNSVKFGMGGKELADLEELNEDLESKIGLVCEILNVGPSDVLSMHNYQVGVLIREHNRQRINAINDLRLAYHGGKNEYIKYTHGLMGEIVYTGEEIMKDPSLLSKVVH
jgi:hypothetical protein